MMPIGIAIELPEWAVGYIRGIPREYPAPEDRMRLTIDLARRNVRAGTGGPFGAAVFNRDGRLISAGMNLVTALNCSVLHAEIVALVLAQQKLERFDLSDGGKECFELVSAAEPCAMCLGAIPWSGVSKVIIGARDADVRSIGFDEGIKPAEWFEGLRDRGIVVQRDVLREEATAVLKEYVAAGGEIYNPGRPIGGCCDLHST